MSQPIRLKRGDSFVLALKVSSGEAPQDLTGWEIRSSIGSADGKVADLAVNIFDQTDPDNLGQYVLSGKSNTWPVGPLFFDIRYTTNTGEVITTETADVLLVRAVTP